VSAVQPSITPKVWYTPPPPQQQPPSLQRQETSLQPTQTETSNVELALEEDDDAIHPIDDNRDSTKCHYSTSNDNQILHIMV
jgi:hypothetical protein